MDDDLDPASDLTKLSLVLWKNSLLLIRKPLDFLLFLFLSIALICTFCVLRESNEQSIASDMSYQPARLNRSQELWDVKQFAYFPKKYKSTMDRFDRAMRVRTSIGFDTETELVLFVQSSEVGHRAGITFKLDEWSNVLQVALRFFTKVEWDVKDLWGSARIGIRDRYLPSGSQPAYYLRGFVRVQQGIFEAVHGRSNVSIELNRFPVQSSADDEYITTAFRGCILFVLIFVFTLANAIMVIVEEKESTLKEMVLIMGLPNYINWIGYLLMFMLQNLFLVIISVIVWTAPMSNGACFKHTDEMVLFVFTLIFVLSLSSFAMLLSNLFSTARHIYIVSIILLFVVSFPVSSTTDFRDFEFGLNVAVLLLGPSSFGIAMRTFIVYEDIGVGMQWKHLMDSPGGSAFSAGTLLIAMCVQSIVYLLIALYLEQIVPGEMGPVRKWYFPLEWLCQGDPEMEEDQERRRKAEKMNCKQMPGEDAKPVVVITDLSKEYANNFFAVNRLTTTLYESEITVLLGENGAGKSTTIAMLTGMLNPTSGNAVFKNEFSLRWNLSEIRQMIGLCPQRNVLFKTLTVREHLVFFGRLKGQRPSEALRLGDLMLMRCGMFDKADSMPRELSGGMRRKLSMCIALAGGAQVIFLDEPTSGVDPGSMREIWKFLQEEKKGRTILMSTHFMDEADVLGDRVAILHNGDLKCAGSSFYLKNTFNSSYTLTCALKDGARLETVTEEIKAFVADARLRYQYGQEVTYELSPKSVGSFGNLFARLELIGNSIGVESFGIELPGLEDVFLKITTAQEEAAEGEEEVVKVEPKKRTLVTGPALFLNQMKAIFKKRFFYSLRNPSMWLFQLLLPVLGYLYIHYSHKILDQSQKHLTLSLEAYVGDRICLVQADNATDASLVAKYKAIVEASCKVLTVPDMEEYIFKLSRWETYEFLRTAMIGAKFVDNQILAMFSNEPLHTVPMAITAAYNCLIKARGDPKIPQLLFVNYPVPWISPHMEKENLHYVAIVATLGTALWTGLLSIVYIEERVSGAMALQYNSGISPLMFWLWSFIYDLLTTFIGGSLMIIAYGATKTFDDSSELYEMVMLFAFACLPMTYLLARISKSVGYFTLWLTVAGLVGLAMLAMVEALILDGQINEDDERFFMFYPYFNVMNTMVKQAQLNDDMWRNQVMFLVSGIFFLVVLIAHDRHMINWLYIWQGRGEMNVGKLDEGVLAEIQKVDIMTKREIARRLLVVKHLQKSYGEKVAVRDATFTIQPGECLGLLGKNGAGKSTTFKMLTGEIRIMDGDAWLNGISIKTNLMRTHKFFGYCPQYEALLRDLTASEWMDIVCLIRGIAMNEVRSAKRSLATELGFAKHLAKKLSEMSSGNKRKLSTALAMIADPALVYMDEPTTGMDPTAKRCVWNKVNQLRQQGHSILLTSHSMDECEALCTRLIIMADGKMEAIATSYQLKQRYSKTGQLIIQLEREFANDVGNIAQLERTLVGKLDGFIVKAEYQGKLECDFNANEKLSKLYILMESLKAQFHIDSYGVSNRNSLVSIFLDQIDNTI